MAIREEPIEKTKRKHSVPNFTFYLTYPITTNTSTVSYITHLVPAGNMEDSNYKCTTNPVFMLL